MGKGNPWLYLKFIPLSHSKLSPYRLSLGHAGKFFLAAQMGFSSWAAEFQRFKDALANQPSEMLLKAGYTNGNGQTVTFKRYEDIQVHLNYLEQKASIESSAGGRRRMMIPIGYGGRC